MKRGPKPGRTQLAVPALPAGDLGDCPAELVGPGRDLWLDAVAHLRAVGRTSRVYRHPLRLVCRVLESLDGEMGINRIDAARRWLREMGLTPTSGTGATGERPYDEQQPPQTGRARVLSLIARKKQVS